MKWVNEEQNEFQIVSTLEFARQWGDMKASKCMRAERHVKMMTYEKVSRTLRYYCGEKLQILEKVKGKRCHFQFGNGKKWCKNKM